MRTVMDAFLILSQQNDAQHKIAFPELQSGLLDPQVNQSPPVYPLLNHVP